MSLGGQRMLAHRLAYVLTNGPILPDKPFVCHHCDNPPCCNGAHLFAGTNADNMRDKCEKGRHKWIMPPSGGESNGRAQLTEDVVLALREEAARRESTYRELACKYGAPPETISKVVRGETWPDVGGPRTNLGKGHWKRHAAQGRRP